MFGINITMNSKATIQTDTWVVASWDEYIQTIEDPRLEKAKGYYYNGRMRIEMSPVGNDHASDHTVIIFAVKLFASIKGIALNGKDNCTYRKIGVQEVQPDASYYIGESADIYLSHTNLMHYRKFQFT